MQAKRAAFAVSEGSPFLVLKTRRKQLFIHVLFTLSCSQPGLLISLEGVSFEVVSGKS